MRRSADVQLPADLLQRLARIPRLHRRRIPWREMALAASLLVAAVLSLLSMPLRRVHNERSSDDGAKFVGAWPGACERCRKRPVPTSNVGSRARECSFPASTACPWPMAVAPGKWPAGRCRGAENGRRKTGRQNRPIWRRSTPSATKTVDNGDARQEASSATIRPGKATFWPRRADRIGSLDLELVSHSLDRGLAPPFVAGYDFVFQLKTGERPFVSPEVNPLLASSPVPLVRDKSSYLLAREHDRRRPFAAGRRRADRRFSGRAG